MKKLEFILILISAVFNDVHSLDDSLNYYESQSNNGSSQSSLPQPHLPPQKTCNALKAVNRTWVTSISKMVGKKLISTKSEVIMRLSVPEW